jgi:hypothetical protein
MAGFDSAGAGREQTTPDFPGSPGSRTAEQQTDTTMNELSEIEMMTAFGGSAQALQDWGAQMASSSLNHAGSTNPILWIPGSIGATIGAAAYYLGWAWSAIF